MGIRHAVELRAARRIRLVAQWSVLVRFRQPQKVPKEV